MSDNIVEESNLVEVDFGVGVDNPISLFNVETKEIIQEFNDALDAAMWLAASQEMYTLVNREVDYSGDDAFDKWLKESSVGEVE